MTALVPTLAPPATKPVTSVVRLADQWYIACTSRELRQAPLKRVVLGVPLVVFREGDGRAATLLDRCPHRNVPLSMGKVVQGRLQCGYHGWQFDGAGACRAVPGLCGVAEGKGRRTPAYATREQDGFVWVFMTADVEPATEPYRLPRLNEKGYTTARQTVTAPGSLHATIENALDVPHTAFLHAGLFRGQGEPNEIEAIVRRWEGTVEAQYVGEPRPEGLIGRILSPSGGIVEHYDRFLLPSIAQVEYRIGTENHILVTSIGTPVSDWETRLYAVISFRTRFPGWLIKPFLRPIALRVFHQDTVMLRAQTELIHRFGGEQFVSTDIDVLGGPIWRLMKQAERGEVPTNTEPEEVRRVRLRV